ncbi:fatty acid synthase S-acetyltransferase [Ophiocordyceps camponoti-floridani]|uniref:Fatty acid synthase S-acetyltransferase n=1 Tax=Ophiocordyceps camponoti-floridani TaxID=2030778 RepID=A0A8H4Q750_9HYPO|nr:fatty acid synthase S-acetyltransferase [Ophiocordyceps camponoti-floridani]
MDPQHRLHAIEDSGAPLDDVAGSATSVFVGAFMYDHLVMPAAAEVVATTLLSYPYFMGPLEHDLVESLAMIRGKPTDIPLYSKVTAALEPEHIWTLIDNGFNLFVEVGPGPVLLSSTREIRPGRKP